MEYPNETLQYILTQCGLDRTLPSLGLKLTEEAVGHSNGLVVGHHEEEGELLPEQVKSFRSVITNKSPEAFEASSKRGGGVIFAHFVCLIYDSWKTAPWHISKVVTTFLLLILQNRHLGSPKQKLTN